MAEIVPENSLRKSKLVGWLPLIFYANEKRMYRALILLSLSGSKPELPVYVANSFISYCFYSKTAPPQAAGLLEEWIY
jgi:hypothetical protein